MAMAGQSAFPTPQPPRPPTPHCIVLAPSLAEPLGLGSVREFHSTIESSLLIGPVSLSLVSSSVKYPGGFPHKLMSVSNIHTTHTNNNRNSSAQMYFQFTKNSFQCSLRSRRWATSWRIKNSPGTPTAFRAHVLGELGWDSRKRSWSLVSTLLLVQGTPL